MSSPQSGPERAVTPPKRPDADFAGLTEPFRRELLAHCYRMLGSVDEAEDVVQETYLRAWRGFGGFQGRSSVRVWLYRIATNACLNALRSRRRRALPSGLGGPTPDPTTPPIPAGPDVAWLEPLPDALVTPESEDPAAVVASRESLRLSLVASLQLLPARQRAVLLHIAPRGHHPHRRLRRPCPGPPLRVPAGGRAGPGSGLNRQRRRYGSSSARRRWRKRRSGSVWTRSWARSYAARASW